MPFGRYGPSALSLPPAVAPSGKQASSPEQLLSGPSHSRDMGVYAACFDANEKQHLDKAIAAFVKVGRELGVIQ